MLLGLVPVSLAGCGAAGASRPRSGPEEVPTPRVSEPKTETAELGDPGPSTVDPGGLVATTVTAEPSLLAVHDTVEVAGTLDGPDDLHLFDLGPVLAGDRFHIEVTSHSFLDPAVGLFDAFDDLIMLNDDMSIAADVVDSALVATLREDTTHCHVVVTAGANGEDGGDYSLRISRSVDLDPATARPQVIYLDFDGCAGVTIGRRPPIDIPAFDRTDVAATCDDADDVLTRVAEEVRRDFAGLHVTVLTSLDAECPLTDHSVVYFGASDDELLGVADSVDEYNVRLGQAAIVFVDSFAVFADSGASDAQLARALANVASHEIGHLLGLNHTCDPAGIMDITATAFEMMADQSFRRSPLHESVFRTGWQNAPALLAATTGGECVPVDASVARNARRATTGFADPDRTPARAAAQFSYRLVGGSRRACSAP